MLPLGGPRFDWWSGMKLGRNLGIVFTVVGAAIGIWAVTRVTSVVGQLHTWQPPFTAYETTTVIGGAIAAALIIVGLIAIIRKPRPPSGA